MFISFFRLHISDELFERRNHAREHWEDLVYSCGYFVLFIMKFYSSLKIVVNILVIASFCSLCQKYLIVLLLVRFKISTLICLVSNFFWNDVFKRKVTFLNGAFDVAFKCDFASLCTTFIGKGVLVSVLLIVLWKCLLQ